MIGYLPGQLPGRSGIRSWRFGLWSCAVGPRWAGTDLERLRG